MRKHKAIRFVMVSTVLFIQIIFLTFIAKAHFESNFLVLSAALFILITIVYSYRHLDLHHEAYAYEKLSVAVWVPLGAIACYSLNIYAGLGSVLSMGAVGTLASFLPYLNKESDYLKQLPASIYCGAFVGMSSVETTPTIEFVILSGLLAGLFFLISKHLFLGIGGKLGTLAFAGVITATFFYWLIA